MALTSSQRAKAGAEKADRINEQVDRFIELFGESWQQDSPWRNQPVRANERGILLNPDQAQRILELATWGIGQERASEQLLTEATGRTDADISRDEQPREHEHGIAAERAEMAQWTDEDPYVPAPNMWP